MGADPKASALPVNLKFPAPLSVMCPHCTAAPGMPCVDSRLRHTAPHTWRARMASNDDVLADEAHRSLMSDDPGLIHWIMSRVVEERMGNCSQFREILAETASRVHAYQWKV